MLARAPLVLAKTASIAATLGSLAAGAANTVLQQQSQSGAIVVLAVGLTVGLALGCCCGLGWGLLLGSASPGLVTRLAKAGTALAAGAAAQQAPAVGALVRAPGQRPVRRPAFLLEEVS